MKQSSSIPYCRKYDMEKSNNTPSKCVILCRAATYYRNVWYEVEQEHANELWSRVAYCRTVWYWADRQHNVELCDIEQSNSILSNCVILSLATAYRTVELCDMKLSCSILSKSVILKTSSNILSICVIWSWTVAYCRMCDMYHSSSILPKYDRKLSNSIMSNCVIQSWAVVYWRIVW